MADQIEDQVAEEIETEEIKEDEISEEAIKIQDDFDKKLAEEGVEEESEESEGAEENKTEDKGEEKNTASKEASEEENAAEEKDETDVDDTVLTDELLTLAVKTGLDLAEAKSFGSAKALRSTLGHIIKAQSKDSGNQEAGNEIGEEKSEEGELKPFEFKPFEMKFEDEDAIDPELLAGMKGVNEHYKGQMEAMNASVAKQFATMKEQLGVVTSKMTNQAAIGFEQKFDSYVDKFAENFESEIGKGECRNLSKDGNEMANRMKVAHAMKAIDKTYSDAKQNLLPEDEVFKQALAMVFPEKGKEISTKKTVTKLEKRAGQAIPKPSGKKSSLTSYDKAVAASKEFDAKLDAE